MAPGLIRAGRAGPLGPEARLLASWPRARSQLSVAVALGVGAALCAIAIAVLLADAVAQVFLGGLGLADVTPRLMGALALAMVRAACLMGQEVVAQRASSGLRAGLRDRLTTHLLALGPLRLTGERTGELVTALGSGMDDVDAWATGYRTARGLAVVVPVLVVLVVAALDPPTAVVLILTGPVLILLLAVIGSRTRAIGARRAAELRWLGGFFLDMLQGLATLRMFGRGQEQVATIRDVSRQYGETTMEVLRTAFQTALVLEWSAAVATAVVAVEVSLRLIDGHIAFDRALMVLVITPECFLPLRQLALRYHSGAAGRAAAQRAFQILDTPAPATMPHTGTREGQPGAPAPTPSSRPRTLMPEADIRFEGVWAAYDGETPVLRGLDLVLPRASVTALVGASGAGKTTCASLLLRFMAPDQGRIMVGGTDLATIERSRWLAGVAWVPQRPHLFQGSVADNIRLGRPDATDEQVRRAARAASAASFIDRLPLGYDTPIGEDGVRLSGGERQRLAVARALLLDAPVVILDEPTSHLDARSEATIGAAIRALSQDRTVLLISHRRLVAAVADRVVTLADGRVAA